MFPLHESSRRQIAMALFCLLCIMPTVGVVGWAITWRLPSHLAAQRAAIAQALGLDVSISSMRHARPGVVVYEDVCLSDPENGKSLLSCPSLEALDGIEIDRRGEEHPALVLQAARMTIDANQWPKVNEALQRRMQGVGGGPELEIRFTADELILRSGPQSQTLYHVKSGIGALEAGPQAGLQTQFDFCLGASESTEIIHMRMVRNREISPPANGFEIDTGRAECPCRLLALTCGELNALGDKCRFHGEAKLFNTTAGLAGEVKGQLVDLDLATSVGQRFGQSITGLADVVIVQAELRAGKLDAVAGRIKVGQGTIGRPLLQSAVDHLQLTPNALPQGDGSILFDTLAASFWLDQKGLSLANCPDVSTAIMTSGGRALLGEPARQPLPVGALVQVVTAATIDSVPATEQAVALAHCLPTPDENPTLHPALRTSIP